MNRRTTHRTTLLLATLLIALLWTPLYPQNRITGSPDAAELRLVWEERGRENRVDEYGTRMWGGVDITGDGVEDFAVYQQTGDHPDTWHFYRGGSSPDTVPFRSIDSVGSIVPAVGNFFGGAERYMLLRTGSVEVIDDFSHYYDRLLVYRITDSSIAEEPIINIYQGDQDPKVSRTIRSISMVDVNRDSVADISIVVSGSRTGLNRFEYDERGQIWIYLGGPDFQLEAPSLILYDTLEDGTTPGGFQYYSALRDFDGDGFVDQLVSGLYEGHGDLVRFRWGDEDSPGSWSDRPFDRTINVSDAEVALTPQNLAPYYQLDADPGLDFVATVGNADQSTSALVYLSGSASLRSRSFEREDADLEFILPERFRYGGGSGPFNDSLGRFEMLPFERPPFFGDPGSTMFLSGGTNGPDADYDAFLPFSMQGWSIGDVTGDGWQDYGASDPEAGVRATGVARVYAGGPYIPLDDPLLSVRQESIAGESGGLLLWPNPVVDRLQIAWRGDLLVMPTRFAVYDVEGGLVVEGEVDPQGGSAVWECGDVATGSYLLVGYGADGEQIASASVVKL